jgi:hypothetical protein
MQNPMSRRPGGADAGSPIRKSCWCCRIGHKREVSPAVLTAILAVCLEAIATWDASASQSLDPASPSVTLYSGGLLGAVERFPHAKARFRVSDDSEPGAIALWRAGCGATVGPLLVARSDTEDADGLAWAMGNLMVSRTPPEA